MDKRQAIIDEIPRLRRFSRALCGDKDLADDLVQDCLERALSRLHTWQENTNMRAWLFTILRNIFHNHRRFSAKRPAETTFDGHEELVAATAPTQGEGLTFRDLGTALEMIPEQHREVILLIGLEGMNYKETAEILGVPIGTVMSRLSRGRAALKNLMDGNDRGDKPSLRRVK